MVDCILTYLYKKRVQKIIYMGNVCVPILIYLNQ